jgi:RimJ/RimL family protein N-acetyltransferase
MMEKTSAIISSERLDLIPLSPAFLELSLSGNSRGAEQLLGLSIPADWFQEQALMQLCLEQLQTQPLLQPWLLRAIGLRGQQVMVGHLGFHTQPDPDYLREFAPGAVEFGYSVYTPFRRQGYAREACAALMQWAFEQHRVKQFVVTIQPDNIASVRLAETFGFRRIGSHIDEVDGLEDIYLLLAV